MKKQRVSHADRMCAAEDALAVRLENTGLWRRAAARWSVVMADTQDEKKRAKIHQRQKWCLSQIDSPEPDKPDCAGVLAAANGTLQRMGLQQAAGDIFRRPGYKKNAE
ncbi:PerC family transcriptional regulator [Citrobacter meridianamericanus]|uniref:PerC family transcriptional regulator n=1 Tax=Citrobacter meridianamericanus TaxID=2894201 RepID=A0ABT1BFV1_9ENTR|nr:PerC family transcriptional regulator [Citrobacter meridianamericanus]